jgi:DNA-binding transcriptional regulator YiaG
MEIEIRQESLPPVPERRRLRAAAGLTGIELAVAMGVSPASVYAWETGRRTPTGLQKAAYLEALSQIRAELEDDAGDDR